MTKHRAVRAVAETGSTTGAATVVLALLSAGALAGLGLVAATELAPGPAPSVAPDSADRVVQPPRSVVVGPGRPTAGNPTPGATPVPATPTPSPGTAAEPTVPEPSFRPCWRARCCPPRASPSRAWSSRWPRAWPGPAC